MKALLKYDVSEEYVEVEEGDVLVSNITGSGLVKDKEYKVEDIKDVNSIVVVNDDGYRGVYNVSLFYKSWKTKEKECYVEVDVFIAEGDSVKHKVVSVAEFKKLKEDSSVEIKLANLFIKNGDVAIGVKVDLDKIEYFN